MASRETLLSLIGDLEAHSRKIAYIYRTQYRRFRWRAGDVLAQAKRFAVYLDGKEIRKGDRVIIWGENCPEWVVAFLGCIFKGVVVVPVDSMSSGEFARKVQGIAKAKLAVLSSDRHLDSEGLPVIHLESLPETISRASPSDFVPANISPNDTVEIVFTSGTTAEPKGVIINHRNIVSNLVPIEGYVKKYGKWILALLSLRLFSLLPLSHMFGQALSIFFPMMISRTVVLMNSLNPVTIRKVIRDEKVWVLITVPRILDSLKDLAIKDYERKGGRFQDLYRASEKLGLLRRIWTFRKIQREFGMRFRSIVSGGAALSRDLEEFWSRLGIAVVQGYGLTETAPIISINNPLTGKKGSIGKIVGDQQIKVGEDGEILVRGPNVAEGYLSESGMVGAKSDEGWFRTGDLGEVDSEGYIYFKGRKKDLIVTAEGMNVFPEDVETVLNKIGGVKESVVIGLEKNAREEVHAMLLLESPEYDPALIIRKANEILIPHQRIKSYSLWEGSDFPRTPTLKIKRREVEAHIKSASSRAGAPPGRGERIDPFAEIVRTISGKKDLEIREGMNISSDLGLGSIDKVELLAALEDGYQVSIDEREFLKCQSIEELKELIKGSKREVREIRIPRWVHTWPVRWVRIIAQTIFFFPLIRIFCSISVNNKENVRRMKPPFIIVSNHVSFMDAPVLLVSLPFALRTRVAPLMMQEFFRDYLHPEGVSLPWRFLVWLAYFISTVFFGGYPFRTEGDFRKGMEYTGELIGRKYCPLIFPEGERTLDGQLSKFKPGIGMMVLDMKIPVIPIRTEGLQKILPIDRYWPRRGKVTVTFGQPMEFESGTYESIAEQLESALRSL